MSFIRLYKLVVRQIIHIIEVRLIETRQVSPLLAKSFSTQ